jgi:hypothetical protein
MMDIRGLVLVNSASVDPEDHAQSPPCLFGLTDVVGKTPLQRVAERLHQFGISPITAVFEAPPYSVAANAPEGLTPVFTSGDRFWRSAENAFNDLAQAGAELVFVIRVGAYAELDFEKMVQFHIDHHCRVSQVAHDGQPLEMFCVSASRRNDAASLFRSQMTRCRSECPLFDHSGYTNRLASAFDFRQFAIDILTLRTDTAPAGHEIKPGVWVAPGGQIEKGARVLAPGFIGSRARVRSGAVITRCTSIERHAQVDCGTVVENSTVLPYCAVGAGLELAHSVAGFAQIWNLRRTCAVQITDQKLLRHIAATSGNRLLASAADFLTYVPRQFWRGLSGQRKVRQPDLNAALRQTSPTLGKTSGYQAPACDSAAANEFPSNLAVARTHGNQ